MADINDRQKMKSYWLTPRRSGYIGSIVFTAVLLALFSGSKFGAWNSPVREACGETLLVLTYPLNRLWEILLPSLGYEGESAMIMAIPMLVSWVLYFAAAGFLIAWAPARFWAKKGPIQSPQHNAGSRPSSHDSPASETPSSLGPRG